MNPLLIKLLELIGECAIQVVATHGASVTVVDAEKLLAGLPGLFAHFDERVYQPTSAEETQAVIDKTRAENDAANLQQQNA